MASDGVFTADSSVHASEKELGWTYGRFLLAVHIGHVGLLNIAHVPGAARMSINQDRRASGDGDAISRKL